MPSRPRSRAGARVPAVVLVALLLAGLLGGNALATPPAGAVAVIAAPAEVAAGTTQLYTVAVTNGTKKQVDAADLTVPEGFVLLDSAALGVAPAGEASVENGTVHASGLALAPGTTATVTFEAVAACKPAEPASVAAVFGAAARDKAGKALGVGAAGDRTVAVTGACALAFDAQPADAEVGAVVTDEPGDPAGAPVTVEVLDAGGTRTVAPVTVGVALTGGAPGAVLGGTSVRDAADGLATFGDLTVDTVARDYALVASSARAEGATSTPFHVWELVHRCAQAGGCAASLSRPGSLESEVDGTAVEGGRLFLTIDEDLALDCGDGFNHAPSTVIVDSIGFTGHKVATLRIDPDVDRAQANNGVAHYQICYLSEPGAEFVPRDPAVTEPRRYVPGSGSDPALPPVVGPALLPDCPPGAPGSGAPCVQSRSKGPSGEVRITIDLPAADPMFR